MLTKQHQRIITFLVLGVAAASALSFVTVSCRVTEFWILKVFGLIAVVLSTWISFGMGQDTGSLMRTGKTQMGMLCTFPFALGFTLGLSGINSVLAIPNLFVLWHLTIGVFLYGFLLGRCGFSTPPLSHDK